MSELDISHQRAVNLWQPFARKFPPAGKAAHMTARSGVDLDGIGGLAEPKDEILTYACGMTRPEMYQRWGTVPPTGLLLLGPPECGKTMLAQALATRTETPFLCVRVPRLILQALHTPGASGEFLSAWSDLLGEMPKLTLHFREIDFRHVHSLMGRRPDLPVAPAMDFLLELIDRTIAVDQVLVVGSCSQPRTLSPIFLEPGRFERTVWVQPEFPGDVVDALELHARQAQAQAGRELFESVNWNEVVKRDEKATIGSWVRLLHATLRRKARCDAADEAPGGVTTQDLLREIERLARSGSSTPSSPGRYL